MFLIQLDDTFDVVDNLLDVRRKTAAGMLQELGHQYFGVFVHLEVSEGVWPIAGEVCVQDLGVEVDVYLPALLLLFPVCYMTAFK